MARDREHFLLKAVAAGVVLIGLGHAAIAGNVKPKAVLELFTSQGCSSCPPADALLGEYAKRDDLIALSYNIDYWDYIGWKDTLARHEFTERQRSYARRPGFGRLYTPQMVINGVTHTVGSNRESIDQAIARTMQRADQRNVPLEVAMSGDHVLVNIGAKLQPAAATSGAAQIWLAIVQRKAVVEITRGENRGKTITYHNIVRHLTPIGKWTGTPMTLKIKPALAMKQGSETCVVLLQEKDAGPILAAAELKTW